MDSMEPVVPVSPPVFCPEDRADASSVLRYAPFSPFYIRIQVYSILILNRGYQIVKICGTGFRVHFPIQIGLEGVQIIFDIIA